MGGIVGEERVVVEVIVVEEVAEVKEPDHLIGLSFKLFSESAHGLSPLMTALKQPNDWTSCLSVEMVFCADVSARLLCKKISGSFQKERC